MARIINENGIDREMTSTEEAEYDAYFAAQEQAEKDRLKAEADKAAARAAILAKLGLTADETAVLLG